MSKKTRFQKGMIVVSIVGLIGYLGSSALVFLNRPEQASQPTPQNPEEVEKERLLAEEKGYEGVLEREPDNEFALAQLAQLRLQMGKTTEAIAPLEKLVDLNPDDVDPQILQVLAALQIQAGNLQGAIAPLEKLVALNPDDPQLKQTLEQLKQQVESPSSQPEGQE